MPRTSGIPGTSPSSAPSGRRLLGAALVLLVALGGHLGGGFLLDDNLHHERLAQAPWPENLSCRIATDDFDLELPGGPEPVVFGYLRPVTGLSLLLDRTVFGGWAPGHHLTNLGLHLLAVWLVWGVGRRIGLSGDSAWTCAVVWGVGLPAGLAAGWISGRSEIVAAVLVLAGLHVMLRRLDAGGAGGLVVACCLVGLAAWAKESALLAPLLVAAALMLASDGAVLRTRRGRVLLGALGLLVAGNAGLRFLVGGVPVLPPPYFQPVTNPDDLVRLGLKCIVHLAGGLTGLPVVPFVMVDALQQHLVAAFGVAVVVIGALGLLLRHASGWRGILLVGWFVIALTPALWVMAFSLYLYLPGLGLIWLLGDASDAWRPARLLLVGMLAIGVVSNLALATSVAGVARDVQSAQRALATAALADGVTDIVLVDAPWWAYGLPSAVRLEAGGGRFRTHFVSFAPGLGSGDSSRVDWWPDDSGFTLDRQSRPFYASPLERFFLCGRSAASPWRGAGGVNVSPGEMQTDGPAVLRVTLPDSAARGRVVVLQHADGILLTLTARSGIPAAPSD